MALTGSLELWAMAKSPPETELVFLIALLMGITTTS
jgi:hypothetical protein